MKQHVLEFHGPTHGRDFQTHFRRVDVSLAGILSIAVYRTNKGPWKMLTEELLKLRK